MEILLSQSNINFPALKKKIHQVAAEELSGLSEPCYYPSLKRYYYDFLHLCGLKEKDIREYVKRFYKGTPASKWKLETDPISNFYLFIMYVFLKRREVGAYTSMLVVYITRVYTNLIHKQIPYCNTDVFKYTLENLPKTHLFVREKTITNSLLFMTKQMDRKHRRYFTSPTVKTHSLFIREVRSRISQSMKSMAELYYKASKEGLAIREPYEGEEGDEHTYQQLERSSRVISDTIKKITVYKITDNKAIEDARNLTKIRISLATMISKNITDVKCSDNIRMILELFIKDVKSVDSICGKDYLTYVRGLMAVKRTKARVYFKQQVTILLNHVIKTLNYQKQYNALTKQTQSLINLYLAYYVTMVFRNIAC